jgi:chloramphenicol 3-O-phosphotransferase
MPVSIGSVDVIIVLTGIMAAGKSTVAQVLAERFPRSAHVRGDVFRRMIVSGRASRGPEFDEQLRLRYRMSAQAADAYADAGFTTIVQDVILGDDLVAYAGLIRTRPCHVVVLAPRPDVIVAREAGRAKTGYGEWSVTELQSYLDATPRIGHWLDTSEQTPEETADEIVARLSADR